MRFFILVTLLGALAPCTGNCGEGYRANSVSQANPFNSTSKEIRVLASNFGTSSEIPESLTPSEIKRLCSAAADGDFSSFQFGLEELKKYQLIQIYSGI